MKLIISIAILCLVFLFFIDAVIIKTFIITILKWSICLTICIFCGVSLIKAALGKEG